jgi:hypothetical protein
MRVPISPLGGVALVAVGGVNVWLLAMVVATHAPEAKPDVDLTTQLAQVSAPAIASALPPKVYRETLARPVFFKSRAPCVPPPPPSPPQPPKPAAPPAPVDPGLQLAGVAITAGASRAYLVGRGMRMAPGSRRGTPSWAGPSSP